MRVYTGCVQRTEDLTPSMRRIVLAGEGLRGYTTTGVGDEYVRLIFPAPGATEPILPTVTGDCLDYDSIDLATMRTYTVRDFDPVTGEVTVDFVVHDGGWPPDGPAPPPPATWSASTPPTACTTHRPR